MVYLAAAVAAARGYSGWAQTVLAVVGSTGFRVTGPPVPAVLVVVAGMPVGEVARAEELGLQLGQITVAQGDSLAAAVALLYGSISQ